MDNLSYQTLTNTYRYIYNVTCFVIQLYMYRLFNATCWECVTCEIYILFQEMHLHALDQFDWWFFLKVVIFPMFEISTHVTSHSRKLSQPFISPATEWKLFGRISSRQLGNQILFLFWWMRHKIVIEMQTANYDTIVLFDAYYFDDDRDEHGRDYKTNKRAQVQLHLAIPSSMNIHMSMLFHLFKCGQKVNKI